MGEASGFGIWVAGVNCIRLTGGVGSIPTEQLIEMVQALSAALATQWARGALGSEAAKDRELLGRLIIQLGKVVDTSVRVYSLNELFPSEEEHLLLRDMEMEFDWWFDAHFLDDAFGGNDQPQPVEE